MQFQYPRLDRRVENRNPLAETSLQRPFQYPRLDRRVENALDAAPGRNPRLVSVSTTGSKGRKHDVQSRPIFRPLFQYPRLDRRVENAKKPGSVLTPQRFQYPRLDRRVENAPLTFTAYFSNVFQYPRLDRRVENNAARNKVGNDLQFQYPRLDRRVENQPIKYIYPQKSRVSVSTTGSKGRKHIRRAPSPRDYVPVSVSTTGSKGRKPFTFFGVHRAFLTCWPGLIALRPFWSLVFLPFFPST